MFTRSSIAGKALRLDPFCQPSRFWNPCRPRVAYSFQTERYGLPSPRRSASHPRNDGSLAGNSSPRHFHSTINRVARPRPECLHPRAIPSTIVVASGLSARNLRTRIGSPVRRSMNVSILVCGCGLKVRAPGATPGRVGRCPKCGGELRVPDVPPVDDKPIRARTPDDDAPGDAYGLKPSKERTGPRKKKSSRSSDIAAPQVSFVEKSPRCLWPAEFCSALRKDRSNMVRQHPLYLLSWLPTAWP